MGTSDASTGFSQKISRKASSLASSIRTKIVLPYAVLTLAVAVAGTFVVTQLVAGSLEERFVNQLVEAGRVASDSVVRQERDHLETLRAMAFTQGVDAAVASGDMHTLNELLVPLAVNDQIDSVEVTDEQGRELLGFRHYKVLSDVSDYTLTTGTDLSDWSIVAQILAGQFDQLGDKFVMLVKEPSGYLFYTGGPIKQEDRIVGAILVGTYLDEFLVEIKQEALADVTFYNDQGQVLDTTFPGGREQVKDILEVPYPLVQSILARPEATLQDKADTGRAVGHLLRSLAQQLYCRKSGHQPRPVWHYLHLGYGAGVRHGVSHLTAHYPSHHSIGADFPGRGGWRPEPADWHTQR
jgi:hypothetical protein